MSTSFNIKKNDYLEPFSSTSPAPRGTDILSCCILRENTANTSNSLSIPETERDFLIASFFSNGTLALKRISSSLLPPPSLDATNSNDNSNFDDAECPFATAVGNNGATMMMRKPGQHKTHIQGGVANRNPSTLSWNELSKEAVFVAASSSYSIDKHNNNRNSIVGMTFNNGTCTVRRIISSHVDVGVVHPQLQEQINYAPPIAAAVNDDDDHNNNNNGETTPQKNQSEQQQQQQQQQRRQGGDFAAFSPPTAQAQRHDAQDEDEDYSQATFPLRSSNAMSVRVAVQNRDALTGNSIVVASDNHQQYASTHSSSSSSSSSSCSHHRYVVVGAALCELSDGRCALFSVSTNLSNKDLLKGLMKSRNHHTDNSNNDKSKSQNGKGQGDGHHQQQHEQQQVPCYPIDAEASILELPPNGVSVEVQVSSSSVLVRCCDNNNNNNNNNNNSGGGSEMICLALDSSGRPVGAASLRGRSLGPFSIGMAGVRALWRIHNDGSCSGNMGGGGGGGGGGGRGEGTDLLRSWVLGGGGGVERTSTQQQRTSCFDNFNNNNNISNQNHQVIATTWLDQQILLRGFVKKSSRQRSSSNSFSAAAAAAAAAPSSSASSPLSNISNVNSSFCCLSVLISEWKEHFVSSPSSTNATADRSVCTILLSQMVSSDPVDTLRGFSHRKICTFPTPITLKPQQSVASSTALSDDGTLLAIASPQYSPSSSISVVGVTIVIMTTENHRIVRRGVVSDGGDRDEESSSLASTTHSRVITFEACCSHPHQNAQPNQLNQQLPQQQQQQQVVFTSKKSVAVFFPLCGCCVAVADVLRVPPRVWAGPILGGGCADSPLAAVLGLRNSEKFPVVPRLARFVSSSSSAASSLFPPSPGDRQQQQQQQQRVASSILANQTSFLQQVVEQNDEQRRGGEADAVVGSMSSTAAFRLSSHKQTTPFVFFGLPNDVDSQSGSVATLVYASLTPKIDCSGGNNNNFVGLISSSSSSSCEQAQRLVDSIGAEAMFLSYQFRNLDFDSDDHNNDDDDDDGDAAKILLLQGGVSLLENFFSRVNFVLTICANLFTKSQNHIHHFANISIEMARHADTLLASFDECFGVSVGGRDGEEININTNNNTRYNHNNTTAMSLMNALNNNNNNRSNLSLNQQQPLQLRQQQQKQLAPKRELTELEESISHLVATAFTATIAKLLQFGLVSVASRIAHSVGPYCSYVVDLVYPSALQLYRQANISPGYASFLHDIENLVSDEGKEAVAALEKLRSDAMRAPKK